jgi:hypothetical protein
MCHIPDEFRNGASVVGCGGGVNENGAAGAVVRKGSGAAGGYIRVLKIGYKECRRWVGERAWQSAESGDVAWVPGMGSCGGEGVRIHAADGHAVAPRWGVPPAAACDSTGGYG